MSKEFTDKQWQIIFSTLEEDPESFGLPTRVEGSALIGSFNIRKLGSADKRDKNTWKFFGIICKCFDLIAIQEAMDDMDGVRRLKHELLDNDEDEAWEMLVSDKTGTFPGDRGLGERLVFFYRTSTVELGEIVSDITYDRSKVMELLYENLDEFNKVKEKYERDMEDYESGERKTKPKLSAPTFLSFIRQPYCASFKIKGNTPDSKIYHFMAINAHLMFGKPTDRWREFVALMEWIRNRVVQDDKTYYDDFVLLGDLNLDYDDPEKDYPKMEKYLKNIDADTPDEVHVNFPFLDIHPNQTEHFTSNISLTQRYDQIGLFFRDVDGEGNGFPTSKENSSMGQEEVGPDYGVFNFSDLFATSLHSKTFKELSRDEQKVLKKHYEHKVSDHMPIWLRLKLSDKAKKQKVR